MKKQKTGISNKTRGLLDLIFFLLMVVVLIPQSTGIPIHEWLSFVILLPFFLHLIVNWSWIIAQSKKLFKRNSTKYKFDYLFNWLLYLDMILVTVSGIVISESALPAIGIHFTITPFWTIVHNTSASLLIILLGIHLALHWKWIVNTIKKLKLKSDFHYLKQLKKVLQERKNDLLLLFSVTVVLSIGMWLIEFSDWANNINLNQPEVDNSEAKKVANQWMLYVLPLIKVSVLLCVPAIFTRLIIRIKTKLQN